MREPRNPRQRFRQIRCGAIVLLALAAAVLSGGCGRKQDTQQRFHLEGKVLSVDVHEGTATIDHKAIPGYMDAMTMPYAAKDPNDLAKISPGDQITADLVEEDGVPLLMNIVVTQKAAINSAPASTPKQ
jgi:protein SCO1